MFYPLCVFFFWLFCLVDGICSHIDFITACEAIRLSKVVKAVTLWFVVQNFNNVADCALSCGKCIVIYLFIEPSTM